MIVFALMLAVSQVESVGPIPPYTNGRTPPPSTLWTPYLWERMTSSGSSHVAITPVGVFIGEREPPIARRVEIPRYKLPPILRSSRGSIWWEHSDGSLEVGPKRTGMFFEGPRKNIEPGGWRKG